MRMIRPTNRESAFTLIEMLIAMVLVSGLLVIASTLLVRSFGESGRSQQERKAMQSVRDTTAKFGNDLRVARAPDRNPAYVGNGNELGSALLADQELQLKLPGGTTQTLDVRDVVEATSRSFAFRADVNPAAGVECVRYAVDEVGGPFVREVRTYDTATRSCGAVLERQELIQAVQG